MSVERDRCAIHALRLALKHLGPIYSVYTANGTGQLTPKGQDIDYIRMTLDTFADVLDEQGLPMMKATE